MKMTLTAMMNHKCDWSRGDRPANRVPVQSSRSCTAIIVRRSLASTSRSLTTLYRCDAPGRRKKVHGHSVGELPV
jgi:hypothetical protein